MARKKDIHGYEGIYKIDENGNIYSKNGNMRKTRTNRDGYECIILTKDRTRKHTSIHRLIALTFIP